MLQLWYFLKLDGDGVLFRLMIEQFSGEADQRFPATFVTVSEMAYFSQKSLLQKRSQVVIFST